MLLVNDYIFSESGAQYIAINIVIARSMQAVSKEMKSIMNMIINLCFRDDHQFSLLHWA